VGAVVLKRWLEGEQDMYRLTVAGLTYVFKREADFRIARVLSYRVGATPTEFQAELNKRQIKWNVDDKFYARH
jgi:hypothetical protein